MIERVDHVALVVSDLPRTIDFYTRLLGFKVKQRLELPGRVLVLLTLGEKGMAGLELIRYEDTDLSITVPADRKLLGLRHFAFHVSNISDVYERLKRDGVHMLPDQPFQQPDGPPIAFGLDPNGVLLEFTEIE